jgi:hypothetical protein
MFDQEFVDMVNRAKRMTQEEFDQLYPMQPMGTPPGVSVMPPPSGATPYSPADQNRFMDNYQAPPPVSPYMDPSTPMQEASMGGGLLDSQAMGLGGGSQGGGGSLGGLLSGLGNFGGGDSQPAGGKDWGSMLMALGGGIAGNATQGWGAGIGAGFQGAALANMRSKENAAREARLQQSLAADAEQQKANEAYRQQQILLEKERNATYAKSAEASASKKTIQEIYDPVSGLPQKVIMDANNPTDYTPIGGQKNAAQNLTNVDKEQIIKADEMQQIANGAITNIDHALEINDKAFEGTGASSRGYLGANMGREGTEWGDAGRATQDLENTTTRNAVTQLKLIFGGNPTEGERAILLDMESAINKPASVRREIYQRAKAAIQARQQFYSQQSDALRGGSYYQQGGAPAMLGGQGAAPYKKYNPKTGKIE